MVERTSSPPRAFVRDGYALLPAFASERELVALRQQVETRIADPGLGACERPHNTLVPLRFDDAVTGLLLRADARVEAIRRVTGASDLRWISGYVSMKDPHSPPLWWHQDWWCWDHPVSFRAAAPQVAVLLYLDATDAEAGALRVLPGSHRRSAPIHARLPEAHSAGAEGLGAADPALRDLPGQVSLAVRGGDAVVLDYRLLHGTHANRRSARRDAILLSFAPAWDSLPSDVRGHLIDHPALPVGDEPAALEAWQARLLPRYDGPRVTLELNRNAPREFVIAA